MTKLISAFTIATLTSVAFAPSAFAGEKMEPVMQPVSAEMTIITEAPEAQTVTLLAEMETEVRGAVESGELVAVEGPDGRIYYNRVIDVSELPDPTLELRILEKFDVSYEGDVYTNKIVQKLN